MSKKTVDSKFLESVEVSERVKELTPKLTEAFREHNADGNISLPKGFLETLLPEDLPIEDVKRVQQATLDVTNSVAAALGVVGLEYLQDNPEATNLSLSKSNLGFDRIDGNYAKEYSYRIPGTGEQKTGYGRLTLNHTSQIGSRRQAGDYRQIATAVAEEAEAVFGG